jgi:hypothetical protein
MSKDLTEALRILTEQANGIAPQQPAARGAAPRSINSAQPAGTPKSGGGGIASPLTETAYANRTWHSEKVVVSTDGLFSMKIKPVKTIGFTDANGDAVTIEYKAPPP